MSLLKIFNKKAVKLIVGISTVAALAGGMAGNSYAGEAGSGGSAISGSFDIKNADGGGRLATIEFRECSKDICMFVKDATPDAQSALGIPSGASDHKLVEGLKASSDGLSGGTIINASWKANGADVTVKKEGSGYEVTAKKMMGSAKFKAEPSSVKLASNPGTKAPGPG